MAKINIQFNNTTYAIDESELAPAIDELQTHLSTVINGSGAVINVGDTDYNIDATKLSTATSDFVAYLGTISGTGSKVTIDGVEYSIDSTKIQDAISALQTTLDNMGEIEERLEGDGSEFHAFAPTSLSFRATAPLDSLQEIQIDGQTVDPSNYTLTEGSTIVTFPIDYLKTLEKGNYEVSVVSEGQSARGDFTVVHPDLNEHGFYYNQPYFAFVELLDGLPVALLLRENGTADIINLFGAQSSTISYTIEEGAILLNLEEEGIFTGRVTEEGIYCEEFMTTLVLSGDRIVADEEYLYLYDGTSGYAISAINKEKASYGPVRMNVNDRPTVTIGFGAFYNSKVQNFVIPNGINKIDSEVFYNCADLAHIEIPETVTGIGFLAFCDCTQLTAIELPSSLTYIDASFNGCTALANITFRGTIEQWNAVNKTEDWNYDVPAIYVQCSDGQVAL